MRSPKMDELVRSSQTLFRHFHRLVTKAFTGVVVLATVAASSALVNQRVSLLLCVVARRTYYQANEHQSPTRLSSDAQRGHASDHQRAADGNSKAIVRFKNLVCF